MKCADDSNFYNRDFVRASVSSIRNMAGRINGVVACLILVLMVFGCREKLPNVNSDAYNALHGIVNDGKTTQEIILVSPFSNAKAKLKFPPEIYVTAYTWGSHNNPPTPIRKGYAHQLRIYLSVDDDYRLTSSSEAPDRRSIRMEITAQSPLDRATDTGRGMSELTRNLLRSTERAELGLVEYVTLVPTTTGQITTFSYVPMDREVRSLDAPKILITCSRSGTDMQNNEEASLCHTSFTLSGRIVISYYFDMSVLPGWKKLHKGMQTFANSVYVSH